MLTALQDMVTTPAGAAGAALAAIVALSGWMPRKGSLWVPPDQSVKKGVTSVATLLATVFCVVISATLSGPESRNALLKATSVTALLSLGAFLATVWTMARWSYVKPEPWWIWKSRTRRILGGDTLTEEARRIRESRKENPPTDEQLLIEANYRRTLVWTQHSLAKSDMKATFAFLCLQVFGSVALFGAGLLISTASK